MKYPIETITIHPSFRETLDNWNLYDVQTIPVVLKKIHEFGTIEQQIKVMTIHEIFEFLFHVGISKTNDGVVDVKMNYQDTTSLKIIEKFLCWLK